MPDNELRSKRYEAAQFQLNYLRKLLPNTKIIRVCQNYTSETITNDCTNIIHDNGIGPAMARNEILSIFYNSDYDWLLLVDDDTVWYEYYSYKDFIHEIVSNDEKFAEIDAISAVEPEYHAYKKLNYEDRNNLTHYKFIPRDLGSGSATTIFRNIKKYRHKELYYPDIDPATGHGLEDVEFHMAWLKAGLNWYTMQTWIRKSLCFDKSSIFSTNSDERTAVLKTCLKNLCERHRNDGLYMTEKNTVVWKEFNARYNRSQKTLYIERENKIEFDETTTPKEQKRISKKLFDI